MRKFIYILILALIVAATHAAFYLSTRGQAIESGFIDLWFQWRGPIEPPQEVLVVSIDEASYDNLGVPLDQAWPRALHAKLLNRLSELGAKRVAFDVLFLGESSDPQADSDLASALTTVPSILGVDVGVREDAGYELFEILYPYDPFLNAASGVGIAAAPEDIGYVRRFLTPGRESMQGLEALSYSAVSLPSDAPRPSEHDFINYYGPAGTIPSLSYYQVFQTDPPLPPELVKDKIVFVGLLLRSGTGPAEKDSFLTPFYNYGRTFGVEIHATSAANLLRGDWIRRINPTYELWLLSAWLVLCTWVLFSVRPVRGGMFVATSLCAWILAANIGLRYQIFIPGALCFGVGLPAIFLLSTLYYYVITRRSQRQIQRAFGCYLSPEMARVVAHDPNALKLGGRKVVATAMFTDLAGFTTISEKLQAEELSELLNTYFTEVMDVILENQGTLVKFTGDGILALWGAPVQIEDHAAKACETAIRIQEECERFNATKRFPPLHTRIGVHTGPMVVGNLGSLRRFDFTAIGDSVNLASRLEGVNKYFGTDIMVSSDVVEAAKEIFDPLRMGTIKVVGKNEGVGVFTVFSPAIELTAAEVWEKALEYFESGKWDDAREAFKTSAELDQRLKKPSAFYLEQIAELQAERPDGWHGEVVFRNK